MSKVGLWGWKEKDLFWHHPDPRDRSAMRPAIVIGFAVRAIHFSYLDEAPWKKYALNNPTKMRRMTMEEYLDLEQPKI